MEKLIEQRNISMRACELMRGTYQINIEKNKERIPTMISTVAAIGSGSMGVLAVQTRVKLINVVVMPSILYNIEVIPHITKEETKKLESIQHNLIPNLLVVPMSTPYVGLLMETGMWTMEARIHYKKLMLCHNIKNSENDRVIKQILREQEKEHGMQDL